MTRRSRIFKAGLAVAAVMASGLVAATLPAQAASSKGCANGGYRLVNLTTGATVVTVGADRIRTTIPAAQLGTTAAGSPR